MPWSARYAPSSAEILYSGELTGAEILRAKQEVFAHAFEGGPAYVICDFSPVDVFHVSPGDVKRITEQDRAAAGAHPGLVEVVVAPTQIEYGMSRMWEFLVGDFRPQTRVGKTRAEVLSWLEEEHVPLTAEHARELAQLRARQA